MSGRRLELLGLAAGVAVAVLLLLLLLRPAPEPEPPATAPRAAPAAAGYDRPAATAPAGRPAAAPLPARVLRAALLEALRAADLPREALEELVAGDVAAAARRLSAAREPGSAALLAELETLCQAVGEPGSGPDAADARATLGAGTREPAAGSALDALLAARHEAWARLAAGCAAAPLDTAATARLLESSARNGDAASLEHLALAGAGDPGRLASAALLGAPRAQLHLGLDHLRDQPQIARSWLEAAAKRDADAQALYGSCLLAGCGAEPDVAAGRAALESAARRGAPYALGLFAAASGADAAQHWLPAGAFVAPVPPADADALGLTPAERYAWAALAGRLAAAGCFGFDVRLAAEALAARGRLERALSPADAAAGEQAAAALDAERGAAIRHVRGCD